MAKKNRKKDKKKKQKACKALMYIPTILKPVVVLFKDFIAFFRNDFHYASYIYTIIATGLSILLVYGTNLGTTIANNTFPTSSFVANNMILFSVMYFLIAVPVLIMRGEFRSIAKLTFFAKGLFLMCLIGFADAFSWRDVLSLKDFSALEQVYTFKAMWWMRNTLFVVPVLILLRLFIDRDVKGLYGLCNGNHHVKAYMYLFVMVMPILIIVSFTPDFLSYYPMYEPWRFEGVFGRPVWLNTVIFEAIYTAYFVTIELIFRGILVIGMISILGRTAVLPMIAVYVALHFGKPVLETMSAFFGGYFLGALAFQTRHIWGGVIIHMGIALFVELIRFFQYYVLGIR
jgi:hypothetical protein